MSVISGTYFRVSLYLGGLIILPEFYGSSFLPKLFEQLTSNLNHLISPT